MKYSFITNVQFLNNEVFKLMCLTNLDNINKYNLNIIKLYQTL